MNAWFIENSGHLTQDGLGTAMKAQPLLASQLCQSIGQDDTTR
jgi:hypothetical protein